jgi:hypothetical protein
MATFQVQESGRKVGAMVFAAAAATATFTMATTFNARGCADSGRSGGAGCNPRQIGTDVHRSDQSMTQMAKLWNYVDGCALGLGDGIVTAGVVSLAIMLALCLGGCARVGQFAAGDAQNAAAVATAVGDTAGAACWPALATTGNAIAAVGSSAGVLTAIEEKRALQMVLQNAACQPVWAGVLAELLKATPAAPFVP